MIIQTSPNVKAGSMSILVGAATYIDKYLKK